MAAIIGLLPALSIEDAKQLGDYVLVPVSKLKDFPHDKNDGLNYGRLAKAYADRQGASPGPLNS